MVRVNERQQATNSTNLAYWAQQAIKIAGTQVRVRVREHKLHVLCEGRECPDRQTALSQLLEALATTNINDLLAAEYWPPVDQVFLYGRKYTEKRPEWTETLLLSEIDRYLAADRERVNFSAAGLNSMMEDMANKSFNPPSDGELGPETATEAENAADFLKNLAREGNTDAIARYIGESLKALGVRVKVKAKNLPKKDSEANISSNLDNSDPKERRLWVFCESGYSPDPSLLAAPIAQKLRDLRVEGFRDAVIISRVIGEEKPDWMLRVDLTPAEEMLKEWASWGDVEAIARLLNLETNSDVEISAIQKETTIHVTCKKSDPSGQIAPEKHLGMKAIAPILNAIAPRGIQAAIIYGNTSEDAPPVWVEWVDLPAARRPELAISSLDLAQDGHEAALAFLLGKMLNPDLDWRITTGGIRVQVRRKQDLLHVMTDAPVCPAQRMVAEPVAKFLGQLEIPGVSGVRVYGRRAGQKQPIWSYGIDLISRPRQTEETTPEFATSDEYGSVGRDELPLGNSGEERLTDVTLVAEVTDISEEINLGKTKEYLVRNWQQINQKLSNFLVRSQLFIPNERKPNLLALPGQATYQGIKVALVWGTAGIMLTCGLDLVLGQILKTSANQMQESVILSEKSSGNNTEENAEDPGLNTEDSLQLPQVALRQRAPGRSSGFNTSGFTKPGNAEVDLNSQENQGNLTRDVNPSSFNNPQLDEKLAIYRQRVAQQGAPDILILGSSRALRGVEPQALKKALAAQGYGEIDIFNFGVNGATAQLVDFLLRHCLTAEQLPKMIVWADGARAFNSGRMDATYNALAASPGYKQLTAETLPNNDNLGGKNASKLEPFTATPIAPGAAINSQTIDEKLSQSIANFSAAYQERDRLQTIFRDGFANTFDFRQKSTEKNQNFVFLQKFPNWDGFLALTIRFDPKTYYQKHPKVTGAYDNDYKDFQLAGAQINALESILQFTQANQIPVVFINLPLNKEYLDPVRSQYEEEFQMYMLSISLGRGFIFRNWSQLWPTKNENFSDPSHLNRYGAAAVSSRLAEDPLIPWPKKKEGIGNGE